MSSPSSGAAAAAAGAATAEGAAEAGAAEAGAAEVGVRLCVEVRERAVDRGVLRYAAIAHLVEQRQRLRTEGWCSPGNSPGNRLPLPGRP